MQSGHNYSRSRIASWFRFADPVQTLPTRVLRDRYHRDNRLMLSGFNFLRANVLLFGTLLRVDFCTKWNRLIRIVLSCALDVDDEIQSTPLRCPLGDLHCPWLQWNPRPWRLYDKQKHYNMFWSVIRTIAEPNNVKIILCSPTLFCMLSKRMTMLLHGLAVEHALLNNLCKNMVCY